MHELAFVFAGFAVGLIVGLTGVGGGSLMTPILIFFFGIKPHMAVGTDLLFAAFTKMGGTVSLARQRLVPWKWWASCARAAFRPPCWRCGRCTPWARPAPQPSAS